MTGEGEVKKFLLAGFAFAALSLPAAAADMPVKAPAPVAVDIWTGGYVGANVGYDWGSDSIDSSAAPGACSTTAANCVTFPNGSSNLSARAASFDTSLSRSGIIYGGQAGHNWLLHNIFSTWDGVLGVEVDFQGKSDSHSATFSSVTADPNFPGFPMNQTYTQTDRQDQHPRYRSGSRWRSVGPEHPHLRDRGRRVGECANLVELPSKRKWCAGSPSFWWKQPEDHGSVRSGCRRRYRVEVDRELEHQGRVPLCRLRRRDHHDSAHPTKFCSRRGARHRDRDDQHSPPRQHRSRGHQLEALVS
jgi:opacity protein-like surface antigen